MLIDVDGFEWAFNRTGYEWVTVTSPTDKNRSESQVGYVNQHLYEQLLESGDLRQLVPKNGKPNFEYYPPFKRSKLWNVLAMTPPTEHGIFNFANKYGSLWGVGQSTDHALPE